MIKKHIHLVFSSLIALISFSCSFHTNAEGDKVVIEKSVYDDISKIDDLKPFVLPESEYDKSVKKAGELREAFWSGNYEELETFLTSVNTKMAPWDLSSLLLFYLERLKKDPKKINLDIDLVHADRWVASSPKNEFSYTFRAHIYRLKGWEVRGTKFFKETPNENFSGMKHYLRFAIADYYQALALNQKNDYAWGSLIALSKASSDLGLDLYDLFYASKEYLPGSYQIKKRYMNRIQPKWGGSIEEMFFFAREQDTEAYPELALLLARTHEFKARAYARRKIDSIDAQGFDVSLNWFETVKLIVKSILEIFFGITLWQDVSVNGTSVSNQIINSATKNVSDKDYWERYGEYFSDSAIWNEYTEAYETVFAVQHNFTDGLYEYANAARQSDRLAIADEYFDKAVLSGISFLGVDKAYYIARFHDGKNKNIDKATKFYNLFLELDPEYNDVAKAAYSADRISWYYSKKAAYNEAFPFSEIAYNLKRNDKRLVGNHCNAFFNVHKYSEAIPYCMDSIAIDANYPWPHYILYEAYRRLGNKEKSAYHHKEYQRLSN